MNRVDTFSARVAQSIGIWVGWISPYFRVIKRKFYIQRNIFGLKLNWTIEQKRDPSAETIIDTWKICLNLLKANSLKSIFLIQGIIYANICFWNTSSTNCNRITISLKKSYANRGWSSAKRRDNISYWRWILNIIIDASILTLSLSGLVIYLWFLISIL